ncbi:phage tail protein, partial [Citrobacter braakii]
MSIGNIPDDIRVPLVWIDIDNSMAMSAAPAQSRKILVVGQQLASATALPLTLNRITGDSMADELYGRGSMLGEMAKMVRMANSYTEMYAMGLEDIAQGAAASATVTMLGTATQAGTLALMINGVSVQVGVSIGDEAATIAGNIIAAITAKPATQVTATAKAEAAATVVLTVKWKGVTGNDSDVRLNYYAGEKTPAGISATLTAFSGGTGTPDIQSVVAALGDDWYTDIIFPYLDAQSLNT